MMALWSVSRAAVWATTGLAAHVAAVMIGVLVLQESAGGNRAGSGPGSYDSPDHQSGIGTGSGSGRGMAGLLTAELYSRLAAGSVAATASAEDVNSRLQQLLVTPAVGGMLAGVVAAAGAEAHHVVSSAGRV
jgi:hypothetical protein